MRTSLYGRPDDYYELLGNKYRAPDLATLNAALRGAIDPNGFVWVVVGDAAKIRPQLDKLGYPVEVIEASEARNGYAVTPAARLSFG